MGTTLRVAGARQGYTLSDRATFEQLAPQIDLRIVTEGDPRLLNTYAVIVDPGRRPSETGLRTSLTNNSGTLQVSAAFSSVRSRDSEASTGVMARRKE
jgi:ABC-type tungstate transport system permease subunit